MKEPHIHGEVANLCQARSHIFQLERIKDSNNSENKERGYKRMQGETFGRYVQSMNQQYNNDYKNTQWPFLFPFKPSW